VSEYIRELIHDDEKRKAEQRLEALLLEGLESEERELTRQDLTISARMRWPGSSAAKSRADGCGP